MRGNFEWREGISRRAHPARGSGPTRPGGGEGFTALDAAE
jgi:hypothetical protein